MGSRPRQKPERLAEKLLAIRQYLEASQTEMAALLGHYITPARVSECERGIREPNLLVLLAYARLARIEVEILIDDNGICREGFNLKSCPASLWWRVTERPECPDPAFWFVCETKQMANS